MKVTQTSRIEHFHNNKERNNQRERFLKTQTQKSGRKHSVHKKEKHTNSIHSVYKKEKQTNRKKYTNENTNKQKGTYSTLDWASLLHDLDTHTHTLCSYFGTHIFYPFFYTHTHSLSLSLSYS